MEKVVEKYVDKCLGFVQEHREYLMYVSSYEEPIESEMRDSLDNEDSKSKCKTLS